MNKPIDLTDLMIDCPCEWFYGFNLFPTKRPEFVPFKGNVGIIVSWEREGMYANSTTIVYHLKVYTNCSALEDSHHEFAGKLAKYLGIDSYSVIVDDTAYRIDDVAYSQGLAYIVSPFSSGKHGYQLQAPQYYDCPVN